MRSSLLLALCLALLALDLHGAIRQLVNVNTGIRAPEEGDYIGYAREMAPSNYSFLGG